MASFFKQVERTAENIEHELVKHPGDFLAGPGAIPLAYAQSRGGLKGIVAALGGRVGRKVAASIPNHAPSAAPELMAAGLGTPFTFHFYTQLAAASAITAKTKIVDLLTTAVCPQLSANNKFPNVLHSYRLRLSVLAQLANPTTSKESIAFLRTLYIVFKNQTEVARTSIEELEADFQLATMTTSGASAFAIDANEGCPWNVTYDTNASYAMEVTSDFGIASTAAIIEIQGSIEGVLYQGVSENDSEVPDAIKRLYGN